MKTLAVKLATMIGIIGVATMVSAGYAQADPAKAWSSGYSVDNRNYTGYYFNLEAQQMLVDNSVSSTENRNILRSQLYNYVDTDVLTINPVFDAARSWLGRNGGCAPGKKLVVPVDRRNTVLPALIACV